MGYNNTSYRNIKGNSVRGAKLSSDKEFPLSRTGILFIGMVLGVLTPLVLDFLLFGSFIPCQTTQVFEDGSSIQSCEVRR